MINRVIIAMAMVVCCGGEAAKGGWELGLFPQQQKPAWVAYGDHFLAGSGQSVSRFDGVGAWGGWNRVSTAGGTVSVRWIDGEWLGLMSRSPGTVISSEDGLSWSGAGHVAGSVIEKRGDSLVAATLGGTPALWRSGDGGQTWAAVAVPSQSPLVGLVASDAGFFAYANRYDSDQSLWSVDLMFSEDGRQWSWEPWAFTGLELVSIAETDGKFVAIVRSMSHLRHGYMYTFRSSDGRTWRQTLHFSRNSLGGGISGNLSPLRANRGGFFYFAMDDTYDKIVYSRDYGNNWDESVIPYALPFVDVAIGNGRVIVLSSTGAYATSPFSTGEVVAEAVPDLAIERAVVLRWVAKVGKRYQVEKLSSDGRRWDPVSDVMEGAGGERRWVVLPEQAEEVFRVVELR